MKNTAKNPDYEKISKTPNIAIPAQRRVAATLCIALMLTATVSAPAYAHAVVTESSLRTHPVPVNKATTVVLFFNAGVELALSRVFLFSAGDVSQPVDIALGKKPGEMIIHLPALAEGDYALKYKVFAADGHLTEDVLRFRVSSGK